MKVLIVSHFEGEGKPSAIFVCDQAAAYRELGAEVRMIVPVPLGKRDYLGRRFPPTVTETEEGGIRYVFVRYLSLSVYGKRRFNTESAIRSIRANADRIFSGFTPDVIQAHTLEFDSGIGSRLKEELHCPLVITTHGSDTSVPYEEGNKAMLRKYCSAADTVVCVSGKLKRQLEDCRVETPLRVIHNGFHPGETNGEIPEGYDWIQVCNLLPQKHVETTLRAFHIFHGKYPDSVCRIVGQGPERERLETLARELGIEKAVRFLGQMENSRVREEMARSRFFVMVSHPEGFGIVYLEAMSAGCITIGTQGEGITDIVESGKNGFLAPADDPEAVAELALRCAADPTASAEISRRAVQTAQGLTWRVNAEKNLKLFEDLMS